MTPAHKFACMNITFLHAWAGLLRSHGRPNIPSRRPKESSRMAGGVGWGGWGWGGGMGWGGGSGKRSRRYTQEFAYDPPQFRIMV